MEGRKSSKWLILASKTSIWDSKGLISASNHQFGFDFGFKMIVFRFKMLDFGFKMIVFRFKMLDFGFEILVWDSKCLILASK